MRIGELAEATGASVRSLRYYEQQGLLRSERTGGGQRDYADDAVEYVRLIRCCLRAGLPTKVIAEIMPCMHSGTTTGSQRALLQAAEWWGTAKSSFLFHVAASEMPHGNRAAYGWRM